MTKEAELTQRQMHQHIRMLEEERQKWDEMRRQLQEENRSHCYTIEILTKEVCFDTGATFKGFLI